MTWGQPAALWLLAAVVLLLLVRRVVPRERVTVATLHLWSGLDAPHTSALARRVSRHRLLLLQIAVIVCIVLALARPQVAWSSRSTAIVLDVSMSMAAREGAGTRLERAIAAALSTLDALPWGSRTRVYLAGPTVVEAGEFAVSDAALATTLNAVRATDAPGDIEAAIAHARANLAGARIYVFSDASVASSADDVIWTAIGSRTDNAALTTLVPRVEDDGTVTLLVGAWNFGASPVSGEVVTTHDQAIVGRARLELPAGGGASVVLRLPALTGAVAARLDVADALAADNLRLALVSAPRPARALVIGRSRFVEQALATYPRVAIVASDSIAAAGEPDLVVCAGCDEPPRAYPHAGLLWIRTGEEEPRESAPLIVTADTHPVMEAIVSASTVVPIASIRPIGEDDVLARAGTVPAITAYEHAGRRVVELRFDPDRSAATLEPLFPLLIANTVDWLVPGDPSGADAGAPLRLRRDGAAAAVTGPDGQQIPHTTTAAGIIVVNTETAGIYRVVVDGREHQIAVNPSTAAESNLNASSAPGGSPSAALATDPALTPLSTMLLLGALALLALEWRQRVIPQVR